jgi:hypothetical protein
VCSSKSAAGRPMRQEAYMRRAHRVVDRCLPELLPRWRPRSGGVRRPTARDARRSGGPTINAAPAIT